jgi:hypothetical protein
MAAAGATIATPSTTADASAMKVRRMRDPPVDF